MAARNETHVRRAGRRRGASRAAGRGQDSWGVRGELAWRRGPRGVRPSQPWPGSCSQESAALGVRVSSRPCPRCVAECPAPPSRGQGGTSAGSGRRPPDGWSGCTCSRPVHSAFQSGQLFTNPWRFALFREALGAAEGPWCVCCPCKWKPTRAVSTARAPPPGPLPQASRQAGVPRLPALAPCGFLGPASRSPSGAPLWPSGPRELPGAEKGAESGRRCGLVSLCRVASRSGTFPPVGGESQEDGGKAGLVSESRARAVSPTWALLPPPLR